jgi:hypothetical protein
MPDSPRSDRPDDNADLVSVFETTEAGLLPLARAALEQAGIDYPVENRGLADQLLGRRSSMTIGETDTPLHVVVRAEDAARARELLGDLGAADGVVPAAMPADAPAWAAGTPGAGPAADGVELTIAETGASVGRLTSAQFEGFARHLERESSTDDDYWIDEATIAMLEDKGADPAAITLLRHALAGRADVTVRWRR